MSNAPWSYVGNSPPAGTVAIGSDNDCGDDFMQALLPAGTYTLVLTDANYIPNAIYDNGALTEGFTDFTASVFHTCDAVSNACITPDGNYAVEITSTSALTPEPGALSLVAIGSAALVGMKQFRKRRHSLHIAEFFKRNRMNFQSLRFSLARQAMRKLLKSLECAGVICTAGAASAFATSFVLHSTTTGVALRRFRCRRRDRGRLLLPGPP